MGEVLTNNLPRLLVVCHGLSGHLIPLVRITDGLVKRGWQVSFLGPSSHRRRIEETGADFMPLTGLADLDDKAYYENHPIPGYHALHWVERGKIDLRLQCLEPLVEQWENLKSALVSLNKRSPQGQVIIIAEAFFLGVMPLKYGATLPPGINIPRSICVSITVPAIQSVDLPPFVHPLPFDQTEAGRERNRRIWERRAKSTKPLTDLLDQKLLEAGTTRTVGKPLLAGDNYTCHEVILQCGVPGFEYARCDWPPRFKFVGLVQGASDEAVKPDPPFPWWNELKHNSSLDRRDPRRKYVVLVAQGTVEVNPRQLIIPTIQAFADRNDILVVAVLGWKDAKLSDFVEVPGNARIADYLSYDAALEHANVWVHNAGFGAVNHGIAHGVPMVVAGEGMDKTENARRVTWSGIGVDLGTAEPSTEQVRQGIETVLQGEAFSRRVQLLQQQSRSLDCISLVHDELIKLVG
ncbi:hypothetical protein PFICI_14415 [Pestalotiopsis fici W106-1]|uniref:Erythromycin biosynthesis protein CIII-like C-terminal domain-containing protein n=1 Tax=Pestalotiopsis fici (strain W106-1 / CGMCC3.15140) TaxID=1229662 RepID=W3WI59_PESFW|nr:uncharacterized protein PFICI_14415 [Pestalotiopsis fici W106-1]ETS73469.1 hypothetical protein PFICI_14415 [Pestalotiopsis fici W106-1]